MENVFKYKIDEDLVYYYGDKPKSQDSGMDLYCPNSFVIPAGVRSFKLDLKIKGAMYDTNGNNMGYTLVPRSSMGSKTPLRLCNSVGIIDSGYRGNLMAFVDNVGDENYVVNKGDRLFQIVAFNGYPIVAQYDKFLTTNTPRGEKGFGSTGK